MNKRILIIIILVLFAITSIRLLMTNKLKDRQAQKPNNEKMVEVDLSILNPEELAHIFFGNSSGIRQRDLLSTELKEEYLRNPGLISTKLGISDYPNSTIVEKIEVKQNEAVVMIKGIYNNSSPVEWVILMKKEERGWKIYNFEENLK